MSGKMFRKTNPFMNYATMQMVEEAVEERTSGGAGVKLSGVRVKVVGGELEVLQEFGSKLDLDCSPAGKACKVCFYNGE
jgi:hypothetical protein